MKKNKIPQPNKPQKVLFHQVAKGQKISYAGMIGIKIAPKKAMTEKGSVMIISDATEVTLVEEKKTA